MNNKHLACVVILLLCVVIVQGVLTVHRNSETMLAAADKARREADMQATTLRGQKANLDDLGRKTADLLEYLGAWEPHFSRITTPDGAEVNVNALIRQVDLLLLAQRFEIVANQASGSVPNAANDTIPQIMRAHLTIEDDFVKSLNWLGDIKEKIPTARVSELQISRGQSGNDVRMNLVVDVPLARVEATPTPAP